MNVLMLFYFFLCVIHIIISNYFSFDSVCKNLLPLTVAWRSELSFDNQLVFRQIRNYLPYPLRSLKTCHVLKQLIFLVNATISINHQRKIRTFVNRHLTTYRTTLQSYKRKDSRFKILF